jgi:hypothetical protein
VTNRKCGTCRYFEEGGIAASGWCRHPDRQDLQHMVLVRKTELACRNGWDHDLWEPKANSGTPGRSSSNDGAGLRSTAADSRAGTGSGNWSQTGQDVGEQVRDQVVEDRVRSFSARADLGEPSRRQSYDDSGSSEPVIRDWSSSLSDDDPFRGGFDSGVEEVQAETISLRGITRQPVARSGSLDPAAEQTDLSGPPRGASAVDRVSRDAENEQPQQLSETIRWGAPASSFVNGSRQEPRFGVTPGESEPIEQSGMTEPFDIIDASPSAAEQQSGVDEQGRYGSPARDEYSEAQVMDDEPLDDSSGTTLTIPLNVQQQQCCRTCRDFRPTDGGKQGWCNNPYAFERKTRVDADQLTCKSTFGNWWTPSDDWWMERADISHHSAPTPHVEDLVRSLHAQEEEGSTPDRKRA